MLAMFCVWYFISTKLLVIMKRDMEHIPLVITQNAVHFPFPTISNINKEDSRH